MESRWSPIVDHVSVERFLPQADPAPWAGIDACRVGQRQQLVVQRVVELPGELVAGDALRGQQVRSTDIADEQRVAREDGVGSVGRPVVHDHADRLGRVARCVQHLEHDLPELDALAVGELAGLELGLGERPVGDLGAGGGSQLEVAGEEVGVEVGLHDELDRQPVLGRRLEVRRDVAARVDDHGPAGGRVADEVRGLREAVEVVLFEDHRSRPPQAYVRAALRRSPADGDARRRGPARCTRRPRCPPGRRAPRMRERARR